MRTRTKPRKKPATTVRQRISILAALGWSPDRIALALGVKEDSILSGRYRIAYERGPARCRSEVLLALYELVRKTGNASALKLLMREREQNGPIVRVGRRARADLDAIDAAAGTGWASILPRRSVQ